MTPETALAEMKRGLEHHDRNVVPGIGARALPWSYVATLLSELDAARARAEELERERDKLIAAVGEHVTVRSDYYSRATLAESKLAEAVKALEPFIRHGRALGAFGDDPGPYWICTDEGQRDVPAEDFRRALASIRLPQASEGGG